MVDRQALVSSLEKAISEPVFQAAIAKALAESLAATFCDIQQDQADLADHMSQAKPPEAFGPGLKVMGHAVVHGTGNSQWDKKRVELLDFCKVSGKYLVRTIYPQAAYGSRQITWVDRQSIDHSSSDVEQPKPAEATKQSTEPPNGWRWLEVGEKIRKGDLPCKDGLIYATEPIMLGMALQEHWKPMIRRNKFEVGEKVVEFINNRIGVVKDIEAIGKGIGKGKAFLYYVEMQDTKGMILFSPHQLAPYIEDNK